MGMERGHCWHLLESVSLSRLAVMGTRAGTARDHAPSEIDTKICIAIRKRPTNAREVGARKHGARFVAEGGRALGRKDSWGQVFPPEVVWAW